jgi:hypothetical protein
MKNIKIQVQVTRNDCLIIANADIDNIDDLKFSVNQLINELVNEPTHKVTTEDKSIIDKPYISPISNDLYKTKIDVKAPNEEEDDGLPF